MSIQSSIRDNHAKGKVAEFLKEHIASDSKLSIVSAFFTIYAYEKLKKELDGINHLKFLFGEPRFIQAKDLDPELKNVRAYKFEDDTLTIKLENKLQQKKVAKECAEWLRQKAEIRSMVKPNFLHGKLYHIEKPSGTEEALMGSSNFTVNGLGLGNRPNIELNLVVDSNRDRKDLKKWFDDIWNNEEGLVEDVKDQVLKYLETLHTENDPEFIYFKTLYHLFQKYLENEQKGGLLDERTGFFDSEIWHMLYEFQKDGVKGAINKIEKHGGCIIADSVGLGKTFEALAVIRYYELKNQQVLVLCPKKLSSNWTVYQASKNNQLNPFKKDRFNYHVLYHTDLGRNQGISSADGHDFQNIEWGNYSLIVIDESHNFRGNPMEKLLDDGTTRMNRAKFLMDKIIQSGVKTKVLLLSATPVNNNLRDLRNQLSYLIQDNEQSFYENTQIKDYRQTLKLAQTQFTTWADKKNKSRTVKNLLEKLDSSFFKLLDELTIARSRKHIVSFYNMGEIGKFPDRLPPQPIYSFIDLENRFFTYDALNKKILQYKLSIFNPSAYVKKEFQDFYEQKVKAKQRVLAFKQSDREHFLINMMKVNYLKRLESSIESFQISMDRTIARIERLEQKINAFIEKKKDVQQLDLYEFEMDETERPDVEDDEEQWEVGKKLRFNLAHLDLAYWLRDLQADKEALSDLYNNARAIDASRDAKLHDLKKLIIDKIKQPINPGNNKVLVFTAFADTAKYLYDNLNEWSVNSLGLQIAMVAGSHCITTFGKNEFSHILTNFSPVSKNRAMVKSMAQEGEIDILIATDCISEGQNLQDCDCIINYDIHWNPVRIIQRFGRIDRLGSKNDQIRLINFWPTKDLDNYINLKERVEARMALVDVTATGEDNILDTEQIEELITDELKYRNQQLKRLQKEILDVEELDDSISLTDFTLDDFRIELSNYIKNDGEKLQNAALGLYAIVPSPSGNHAKQCHRDFNQTEKDIIQPGVIYCLRQKGDTTGTEDVNPLQPYFLVYVREDGTVRFNYVHAKQVLEMFRLLCQGVTTPYQQLCDWFNTSTNNGSDMAKYNQLAEKAIDEISRVFKKKVSQKLTTDRGAVLVPKNKQATEADHFELITWLIII